MTAIMIAVTLSISAVSAGTQDLLSREIPRAMRQNTPRSSPVPRIQKIRPDAVRITAMQIHPRGVPYRAAVFEKRQAGNKKRHSSAITEERRALFPRHETTDEKKQSLQRIVEF